MGRWIVVAVAVLLALPAGAEAGLPAVSSGHRPGPDALYAPPGTAPQLENAAPWRAEPILVSGASAYRDGEFLYQDFLYDDHGALGVADPSDPFDTATFLFSPKAGTLTYPADPVFANNAADLVELRVKPLPDATAFRVTLNTLKDPERSAFTIALGGDDAHTWPHGAGVSSPAQLFLTVHGSTGELIDAAGGARKSPVPTVTVDARRHQYDVRVPHAAWNPGTSTVRMAAGVGLWDVQGRRYLAPALGQATATTPGGGAPTGAALFNVAFRFEEPFPDVTVGGAGITIADAAVGAKVDRSWWREHAQADALLAGDVSPFFADVDFGKLAANADDDAGVPKTGAIDRILASRHAFGQGVDYTRVCFTIPSGGSLPDHCEGSLIGPLQPYALYVPRKPKPAGGYGLTLLLHSLSANYNQYSTSRNQSQLGERGAGSLIVTPSGRGPDGWYADIPEADTFEVWADVARHYDVDPDWAAVSGYSMGGYGTFRLLSRWPDLFAAGFSVVGPHGGGGLNVFDQFGNLRNTPVMAWAAVADELVNITETEAIQSELGRLGLRFVADLFAPADHLTLATNDEYGPGAEFLGERRVDRDPPHVTYAIAPDTDSDRAGAVADHAYWVSDIRRADAKAPFAIDARSEAFGVGDPPALGVQQSAGALEGGARGPLPYVRRAQDWGPAPATARADRLVVRATNVTSATIDARRARLSCTPQLSIESATPVELRIACPPVRRCARVLRIDLPRVRGRRITAVTITRRGRVIKRVRGRDLRRVSVRRPRSTAFSLRIRARATSGRRVTLLRRFAGC